MELIKAMHIKSFFCFCFFRVLYFWQQLWLVLLWLFLAEQFKGKIPVPPIQELFELEPNVLSKRWDRLTLILSVYLGGEDLIPADMIISCDSFTTKWDGMVYLIHSVGWLVKHSQFDLHMLKVSQNWTIWTNEQSMSYISLKNRPSTR